jgi:hypothetical protein
MSDPEKHLSECLAFAKLQMASPAEREQLVAVLQSIVDSLSAVSEYESLVKSLKAGSSQSQETHEIGKLP